MSIQVRTDNTNYTFVLNGTALDRGGLTLEQDAARAAILETFTVLAEKVATVATTGTAGGSNVGDGTVTAVAKLADGKAAIVGDYVLTCTAEVANGGVFSLVDPNGALITNSLVLTAGAGAASIFEAGGLIFTITDGAEDFDEDDVFTITVTAVGKLVPLDPSAVDGSQLFAGIYTQADITAAAIVAGDVTDIKMITGGKACIIDEEQLVFENSVTLETQLQDGRTLRKVMADIGIFTTETQDISNLENT